MSDTEQQAALQKTALNQIRAVAFDLDDTFWDCAPAISRAEDVLLKWLKEHHPALMANHTDESIKTLRAGMYDTHKHLATDVTLMRKAMLGVLAESYAKDHKLVLDEIVEQAFAVFYKARSQVVLYEGTHQLLQALKPNYKLATITNGNADLELIGLAGYFEQMLGADIDNPPKPAIDLFASCCKDLNIAANELLHVGDNPHTDVLGGHNAGVWTVWYNQANAPWPADVPRATFEVHSLKELQQLLTH